MTEHHDHSTHSATDAISYAKSSPLSPQSASVTSSHSIWSGFHKKSLWERHTLMKSIHPEGSGDGGSLPDEVADVMVENCVGVLGLPLAVAPYFMVDHRRYLVPMVTEEPSIVAAASAAAKLIASDGGFHTQVMPPIMIGHIYLTEFSHLSVSSVIDLIHQSKSSLISTANSFCERMVQRGGGVCDIVASALPTLPSHLLTQSTNSCFHHANIISQSSITPATPSTHYHPLDLSSVMNCATVVVAVYINVRDCMGANVTNHVVEHLSPHLEMLTAGRATLRILTNLAERRLASSSFRVRMDRMAYRGVRGMDVARRIIEVWSMACRDPSRAATHNKGIMNGVDAVAIATGQDFRALESGAHSFASKSGVYRPLSRYWIETLSPPLSNDTCASEVLLMNDESTMYFCGELTLPMAVGIVGGAINTHPGYTYCLGLLNRPSSRQLSAVIVSVGLAQNLAALRALALEGIQKGHMRLHAKSVAVASGAPVSIVGEVVAYMISRGKIDQVAAKEYLHAHHVFTSQPTIMRGSEYRAPSTLFVSVPLSPSPPRPPPPPPLSPPVVSDDSIIEANVVFDTLGDSGPIHIILCNSDDVGSSADQTAQRLLLGGRGYQWVSTTLRMLEAARLSFSCLHPTSIIHSQRRLKLKSMFLQVVVRQLVRVDITSAAMFLDVLLNRPRMSSSGSLLTRSLPPKAELISIVTDASLRNGGNLFSIGLPLVLSLYSSILFDVRRLSGSEEEGERPLCLLGEAIMLEQHKVLLTLVECCRSKDQQSSIPLSLDSNLSIIAPHAKLWQASICLLIDALCMDVDDITQNRIDYLRYLGSFFEWDSTIAHDISHWQSHSSISPHSPSVSHNDDLILPCAFTNWCILRQISITPNSLTQNPSSTRKILQQFLYEIHRWNQRQVSLLLSNDDASFFSSATFLRRVSESVWSHYGLLKSSVAVASNL